MRFQIKMGIAALTLGAALASVPAFAQNIGRNANDGGIVNQGDYYPVQRHAQRPSRAPAENFKQGDYYAPETPQQPVNRPMTDGGL
jgi:hypothetical protein